MAGSLRPVSDPSPVRTDAAGGIALVTREREIYEVQTREEGKPEQAWPKVVEGKLNGFFKTVALVEQSFVKDNKQTIDAVVKSLGPDAHIRGFARVKIGEE